MVSKGGINKDKGNKNKNDEFETDKQWLHQSLMQIGQCLGSLALYSDEKLPTERMELMDKAITAFNDAITQYKKDCNEKNARYMSVKRSYAAASTIKIHCLISLY